MAFRNATVTSGRTGTTHHSKDDFYHHPRQRQIRTRTPIIYPDIDTWYEFNARSALAIMTAMGVIVLTLMNLSSVGTALIIILELFAWAIGQVM